MRFLLISILIFVLLISTAQAQHYSENKREFRGQVIAKLKAVGTESAKKIAYDFQNSWDSKFTSDQQEKILKIALVMQKKGHKFYPYFYHYFTYLAYSVTQEKLSRSQVDEILKINEEVVQILSKSEYKEFLFGLNIYFARRYLSLDKNLSVQTIEGTYQFLLLGDPVVDEEQNMDVVQEEDSVALISEDEMPEILDEPADDSWDNNDWDNSNDWDNNNDWDDSEENSWDNNSEATEPVEEKSKEKRPNYTPVIENHLSHKQYQYVHPKLTGPVIEVLNTKMILSTPNEKLIINNVDGTFLLKNRTLAGRQGSVEWPIQNTRFRGAVVQLQDYHLKKDKFDFWTPNAILQFEELTGASRIDGIFEFRGAKKTSKKENKYPTFTSNKADIQVQLKDERISYIGGIHLQGNKLFGKSISREVGILKILDGKGNTVILKSKEFLLGDSVVSMNNGSISIQHGSDSIQHKSVRAKYNLTKKKLMVLRNSTLTPYHSSYFNVVMNIDLLKWNMETDIISMEIMNGKDLLPATFESIDFFDFVRYKKIARSLNFHPINAAVFYARKYGLKEFYVGELAMEYGIDERQAKGAGKVLSQYGFAAYDQTTGFLKLNPKAFLYYDASGELVDFDNLMIPSHIQNGSNAQIQLDSGKLNIRGVSRFYITPDFKIYGEPKDNTLTLLKDRDIEFDGIVHDSDFLYEGTGYRFDYGKFIVDMPHIDSIKLLVTVEDTTSIGKDSKQIITELQNKLTQTSGILHINSNDNRSGVNKENRYPYFDSESEATVFFNRKEVLNGAYDESVKFVLPQFEIDSLGRIESEGIGFDGTFDSGGIFPEFQEILRIQKDGSFGFDHPIPEEGYNLYGTEAKTYEEVNLSNKGIRGYGKIDFLSTTIYSDDFIYYPDSVTTDGTHGTILPGTYKGASYPEATLGAYDMYWLPKKDSMYLRSVNDPFKFYDGTAELEGEANITTKGVYGGGIMLTRGSRSVSTELNFEELKYSARHASFEILTDNPEKPAMEGEDIRLEFDLTNNSATIQPEKIGLAAISFPYTEMKTSITKATWALEDSIVTMIKPDDIPIESSYFYSTLKNLDSLAFNAEKAIYDINTQRLNIQGIPYIKVADSKIIPKGNETTILAQSVLQRFDDAEIIIDTLHGYHYLNKASITILSRNEFVGEAYYQQAVGKDTFDIYFNSFELKDVPVGKPDRRGIYETKRMTVSGGKVKQDEKILIAPGFLYKGPVTMYASKIALELDGFIKLNLADSEDNHWLPFTRTGEKEEIRVPFKNPELQGQGIYSGIHLSFRDALYTTFLKTKKDVHDLDFFSADGLLTYIDSTHTYRIEPSEKTDGRSYQGQSLMYTDSSESIAFEGKAMFIQSNPELIVEASVRGVGKKNEYSMDAMIALEFSEAPHRSFDLMAKEIMLLIEHLGHTEVNDHSGAMIQKLANLTSDAIAKKYELKEDAELVSVSKKLRKQLLISKVEMKRSIKNKVWYNTSPLGISNIYDNNINAEFNGFFEINSSSDKGAITLLIQVASGVWYYISYTHEALHLLSSNNEFNEFVKSKSNIENSKAGESIMGLEVKENVLMFIKNFRLNHLGKEDLYNLDLPDDIVGTEKEEKKKDGEGFE